MSSDDKKYKISNDPDFVNAPKFANSMKEFLMKKGSATDKEIQKMLMMTEEEYSATLQRALEKVRESMGIEIDD